MFVYTNSEWVIKEARMRKRFFGLCPPTERARENRGPERTRH